MRAALAVGCLTAWMLLLVVGAAVIGPAPSKPAVRCRQAWAQTLARSRYSRYQPRIAARRYALAHARCADIGG